MDLGWLKNIVDKINTNLEDEEVNNTIFRLAEVERYLNTPDRKDFLMIEGGMHGVRNSVLERLNVEDASLTILYTKNEPQIDLPGIRYVRGDLAALPFDNSSVSRVLADIARLKIAKENPVFGEFVRILAPGGILVLRLAGSNVASFIKKMGSGAEFYKIHLPKFPKIRITAKQSIENQVIVAFTKSA